LPQKVLLPIPCNLDTYDANLVALPIERTEEFLGLLGQKQGKFEESERGIRGGIQLARVTRRLWQD